MQTGNGIEFTIMSGIADVASARIHDMSGKTVYAAEVSVNHNHAVSKALTVGMYFIHCMIGKNILSEKIVIR